jgi:hypothetical protein
VGPTLDVYGEIRGKITLHGEARAGARLNFGKAEVYWPEDDDASRKYEQLVGLSSRTMRPDPSTIAPTFEAGVRLDAQLDVIVTPQANIGIKIGGGSLVSTTIMDAHLSGYVTGDLSFQASGDVTTGTGAFRSSYGVYVFYNLGYSATAQVLGLFNWALSPRKAWPQDQRINIYGPVSSEIPLTKRSLDDDLSSYYDYGSNGSLADVGEQDTHSTTLLLPRADGDGGQAGLSMYSCTIWVVTIGQSSCVLCSSADHCPAPRSERPGVHPKSQVSPGLVERCQATRATMYVHVSFSRSLARSLSLSLSLSLSFSLAFLVFPGSIPY